MTSFVPQFEDAQRVQCKASIEFEGLSGTGKSGAAMLTAAILADYDWKNIYALDTENRSLRLLVGTPCSDGNKYGSFKVAELTPDIGYAPSNYLAIRDAAVNAGAKVFIQDSISHAWGYKGGVLDKVSAAKASGNKLYAKDAYAAWGDAEVVAEKNKLLEMIRDQRVHVISTVRVKEKMEYTTDENGKTKLESLGEQQIQQADLKYEPDLVLHMLAPGSNRNGKIVHPRVRVIKTRYAILEKDQEYEWTPELIKQLKAYLEQGIDPETIFEQQRQEYVQGIKAFVTENPAKQAIMQVLKEDLGCKDIKVSEMPLEKVKQLYITLIS